ncbi:MAG: transcription-repair coupling factor [Acholeplasmataceae bacterium]|jgi:transcription-repair coupling factor (superfamily II helicase)|nr:transcription-repair coupling factor [Acholeplasmataceae bacterium]
MSKELEIIQQLKTFSKIINKDSGLKLTDLNEGFVQNLVALDFVKGEKTIFLVLPNISLAQKFYDQIGNLINPEDVLFYPADEFLTSLLALSSTAFKTERIYTIGKLLENKKKLIITNQAAVMYKTLDKTAWLQGIIKLKKETRIELDYLSKKLVEIGYKREYTVLKTGEFSLRGSILDIYPIGFEKPFRVDFFDIEIDKIKIFDPNTQRSIGEASEVIILPLNELFYSDEKKEEVVAIMENHLTEFDYSTAEKEVLNFKIDELYEKKELENKSHFIGFFSLENNSIFDFAENVKLYFYEPSKMLINQERMLKDLAEYDFISNNKIIKGVSFYHRIEELLNYEHHEIELFGKLENSITTPVSARDVISYNGNDHVFINSLKTTKETNVISIFNEFRYLKLIDSLEVLDLEYVVNPKQIKKGFINLLYPANLASFNLYYEGINFIHEKDIYDYRGYKKHLHYKSVLAETVKISDVDQLKVGDFVVHYDYGIGQYKGIKTMALSGVKRDYIHLGYQGTDYLYVPVDQVDLILKYSSSEGYVPTLNKLGSNQWRKTKKRVKKKLTDLSDRLLELYAKRQEAKGFSYLPNEAMHDEFSSNFAYLETPDQLAAIKDVEKDMESNKPMDRLICGDVGYGKTEVALRAAFKAVYSGKQVVYLVPTTVLARQHYYLFKERFNPFGVSVKLLSRYVSAREQKEVLTKLEKGFVDVVVGTQRLLSDDVKFKDLGLLIIDEEQRFGVRHKEKIKELKVSIDALSLSATPIPRTLQMSLVGIKDLSMIDTPPLNRYPIQTHIIERHPTIIKEAIQRELARGGQVFYLYNRVDDMELVVRQLKSLVPEAKITYAHGKMNRQKLENVISAFIDKEFDVLVATTIIETGIDIPNTNTLIIHHADRLGLAQLYQIRGRVGRSDKIAYAYLMYDKNKILTPEAEKRLKTIKDFQELGSGFKIAMRDLSIRGAGDLLGQEQSGFIESVGLEMYLKLLEEVVAEQKGIIKEEVVDDQVILSKRHIDKRFISDDEVRLEIHKRIAEINNLSDANNLVVELEDRFGVVTKELKEYMYEKLFYKLASKIGVEKIDKTKTTITLILNPQASLSISGEKLFTTIEQTDYKINLKYLHDRIHITLVYDGTKPSYLYQITNYLSLVLN